MKTIIYIGGFRLPDKNAAAQRVVANAKLLKTLGYNVVFIGVDEITCESILDSKKDIYGFDSYFVKHPYSTTEWFKYISYIGKIKIVAQQYKNVKAIIAYNYQSLAFVKLKKFCKKHDMKLFADCTEWYGKTKNLVKNIDIDYRMKVIHPSIDGVITISNYLYNYYKNRTNVVYLPPLVDCNDGKWQGTSTYEYKLVFTYAGSPGVYKDKLNYIVEALSKIKSNREYIFNIVGITKQQYIEYYPKHKCLVDRLEENVSFKGRISHKEALDYVKNSTFVVFFRPNTLTTRAGFPTKYVEAVTCGVPVITNDTSDLAEYIRDGENGFMLSATDISNIIKKLNYVLSMNNETIRAMKDRCEKDKRKFHYQNYIESMRNFLGDI